MSVCRLGMWGIWVEKSFFEFMEFLQFLEFWTRHGTQKQGFPNWLWALGIWWLIGIQYPIGRWWRWQVVGDWGGGGVEVTSSRCRWWVWSWDGCTCPVSPCLAQIWASGTHSWHSRCLHMWFVWIWLSWASIPGVQTPLAHTCHTRVSQTHIPHIPVPLVHNRVLFYSSPTILKFRVLLVVVEVRGGQVVIVVIVKVIRLMGTATFIVCISSSISVVVVVQHFGVGVQGSSSVSTWTWTC